MLSHTEHPDEARSMLQERRCKGSMAFETKQIMLEMMKESGSLAYTLDILKKLETLLDVEIEKLEEVMGSQNFVLRLLVEKPRITD
jgi:hypothetical protein